MSVFKEFEQKVVRALVGRTLPSDQLDAVIDSGEFVSLEHSGVGYFLTIRHAVIPEKRSVHDEPLLIGSAGEMECGFVVFMQNGELTLECHSWGDVGIPREFRESNVSVRTAT